MNPSIHDPTLGQYVCVKNFHISIFIFDNSDFDQFFWFFIYPFAHHIKLFKVHLLSYLISSTLILNITPKIMKQTIMKGSSNMTNFKINNRTISLTDDQLLLTKQIAILGFVSKSHINMLYSIIKGQQSLLSQHIFSKMVNKLHIWDSVSTSQKRNHTTITVYVLGRTGRSLLRMLHCFARDSQSFSINNHNM